MKTFNQELKSALVAEIRKHREQDQVIQGNYGTEEDGKFRGCAVGCAIDSLFRVGGHDTPYYLCSDHGIYERELGIPRILAELQDIIHEGLSDESFPTWPERFMEAVPTETDLLRVWPKFALWLLHDVLPRAETCEQRGAIGGVVNLLCRVIVNRVEIPTKDWHSLFNRAHKYSPVNDVSNVAHGVAGTFVYRGDSRVIVASLMRSAANASGLEIKEQFYEKCAEKLIELLKAEGNERI